MRLEAVVGLSLLLSALAACTMLGPPILTATGEVAGSSAALAGGASGNAVALKGSAAGGSDASYSLQAVDFDRALFGSVADCFTAASARGLPLVICHEEP